jgi:glucose-6-phosphate isomerase
MNEGLLAGVEAAAGLAVHGGSAASARREVVAPGTPGRLAGRDPTLWGTAAAATAAHRLGWVDGYRRSRELLPQIAELCEELADLDEVVVAAPATAASAIARSLGVPVTVLGLDPPRLRDAVADPHRLWRTVVVLTDEAGHLRDAFWPAYLDSGLTDPEASRHFVAVAAPGSALEASARELGLVVLPADPQVSGAYTALTASALVPAALAGVDVAELLDQAELLAPALAGDAGNPALALGAALASTPGLIALVNDGTGFEGLGDWAAELLAAAGLRAVAVDDPGIDDRSTSGVLTVSYGGSLGITDVPGGGVRPDVAVNGPLGAQFLAWQYAVAMAAAAIGSNPFADNGTAAHP